MSIADVRRAYVPKVDFQYTNFIQQTLAQIQAFNSSNNGVYPNQICPVKVIPELIHRTVWAYLISISGTYSTNVDLVASLNKQEVYRQKIIIQNTAAVNQKYYFCIGIVSTNFGAQREQLITTVANTTNFGICPHYLNIACDSIYMDVSGGITGAAANFDGGIFVKSQAGI